jgi:hypothetical protein
VDIQTEGLIAVLIPVQTAQTDKKADRQTDSLTADRKKDRQAEDIQKFHEKLFTKFQSAITIRQFLHFILVRFCRLRPANGGADT